MNFTQEAVEIPAIPEDDEDEEVDEEGVEDKEIELVMSLTKKAIGTNVSRSKAVKALMNNSYGTRLWNAVTELTKTSKTAKKERDGDDFSKKFRSDLGRMASKAINPIEEDKENKSRLTKAEKIAQSPKKNSLGPLIQQNQNFENKSNKTLKIDENPEKLQNEPKVERAKKQRKRAKQILPKNSIQSEINTIADKNEIQTLKFLLEEKEKAMLKREKDIAAINQANAKKLVDAESLIKNLKKKLKVSAQVFGRYEDGKNEIIELKHELDKADYERFNFKIQVLELSRMLHDTRKENFDLKQENEKLIDNAKENDVEMGGLRIGKEIAELKLSKMEHQLAEMTLEKDTEVEHKENLARMLENRIQIEVNSSIDEEFEALTKVDGEIVQPKNRPDFENLDDDEPELYNNFSDYSSSSDSELSDFDESLEIKIELELQETCDNPGSDDPDYGCEDPDADCKDPDNDCEVHDYGREDPEYGIESDDFNSETCLNPCCSNSDYGCEEPDYCSESDDYNLETVSEDDFSENGYNDCAYDPDELAVFQELNAIKDEKKSQPGPICR